MIPESSLLYVRDVSKFSIFLSQYIFQLGGIDGFRHDQVGQCYHMSLNTVETVILKTGVRQGINLDWLMIKPIC